MAVDAGMTIGQPEIGQLWFNLCRACHSPTCCQELQAVGDLFVTGLSRHAGLRLSIGELRSLLASIGETVLI